MEISFTKSGDNLTYSHLHDLSQVALFHIASAQIKIGERRVVYRSARKIITELKIKAAVTRRGTEAHIPVVDYY